MKIQPTRLDSSADPYDLWRQQMIDETSRFIEWGLAHPELIRHIPTHPVGRDRFPERLKAMFWAPVCCAMINADRY